MCGIYGWVPDKGSRSAALVWETAQRLSDMMRTRGPDDFGSETRNGSQWVSRSKDVPSGAEVTILLGQNRLAIIDLSPDGHQPMSYANERYRIVFNGEIYNYKELQKELEELGYLFKSHSDTEVLLASYAEWGPECVLKFVGMFAFALFDEEKSELFCARDFFGIKPFYYWNGYGGFSFASELPALLMVPGVERKLDPQKAYDYLRYGFVDIGGQTMIEGIHQLPPAHSLKISIGPEGAVVGEPRRYWHIDLSKKSKDTFVEAAAKVRQLFLESIKLHLRSDVPLGIALSGGIDSSSVACAVRTLYPDLPIKTFSYVATDSAEISEEKWIDLVNSRIEAESHKIYVSPDELVSDLDALISRLGEPFVSTSIYAQYRVFKLVRESGVTVTLDGQGADELLAGYIGYPAERVESLLRSFRLLSAIRFFFRTIRWPGRSWLSILASVSRRMIPQSLSNLGRRVIGQELMPPWLKSNWFEERKVIAGVRQEVDSIYASKDKVRSALAIALTYRGLSMLLRHGDRNAMSFSVESRVPFLTKELAEYLLSLPEEYLIDNDGRTKSVFREAMRGIVPDEVLNRRDKIGFQTPESGWFAKLSPWITEILAQARDSEVIDAEAAAKEWREVESGRKPFDSTVWRWINFLQWKAALGVIES